MDTPTSYMPQSAQALPSLPGEHIESVTLDLTTRDGSLVDVTGRVSVWEGTQTVFIDVPSACSAVDRYAASAMLQHAIRDRLIGSDVVRSAVERGFTVKGIERQEVAA